MLHKRLFTTLLLATLLAAVQTSAASSPPAASTPGLAASQTITIPAPQQSKGKAASRTLANFAIRLVVHVVAAIGIGIKIGYIEGAGSTVACLLALSSFYVYGGINMLFSAKKAQERKTAKRQGSGALSATQLGLRFIAHLVCHLVLFFLAWYSHTLEKNDEAKSFFTFLKNLKDKDELDEPCFILLIGFLLLLSLYGDYLACKVVDRWVRKKEDGKSGSWLQLFNEFAIKLVGRALVPLVVGIVFYLAQSNKNENERKGARMILVVVLLFLLPIYLYYGLGWVVDKLFALGKKGAAASTSTAELKELAPSAA